MSTPLWQQDHDDAKGRHSASAIAARLSHSLGVGAPQWAEKRDNQDVNADVPIATGSAIGDGDQAASPVAGDADAEGRKAPDPATGTALHGVGRNRLQPLALPVTLPPVAATSPAKPTLAHSASNGHFKRARTPAPAHKAADVDADADGRSATAAVTDAAGASAMTEALQLLRQLAQRVSRVEGGLSKVDNGLLAMRKQSRAAMETAGAAAVSATEPVRSDVQAMISAVHTDVEALHQSLMQRFELMQLHTTKLVHNSSQQAKLAVAAAARSQWTPQTQQQQPQQQQALVSTSAGGKSDSQSIALLRKLMQRVEQLDVKLDQSAELALAAASTPSPTAAAGRSQPDVAPKSTPPRHTPSAVSSVPHPALEQILRELGTLRVSLSQSSVVSSVPATSTPTDAAPAARPRPDVVAPKSTPQRRTSADVSSDLRPALEQVLRELGDLRVSLAQSSVASSSAVPTVSQALLASPATVEPSRACDTGDLDFDPDESAPPPITIQYDIFLSHKQSDAEDAIRGLFESLQPLGFRCYLDKECLGDTSSLMSSVAASRTFLFFMSQSIFDSKWCLKELMQACRYKRQIILVVESGCTWITPEGRTTSFPDFLFPAYTKKMNVLSNIALTYHREFYRCVLDKIVGKLGAPLNGWSAEGAKLCRRLQPSAAEEAQFVAAVTQAKAAAEQSNNDLLAMVDKLTDATASISQLHEALQELSWSPLMVGARGGIVPGASSAVRASGIHAVVHVVTRATQMAGGGKNASALQLLASSLTQLQRFAQAPGNAQLADTRSVYVTVAAALPALGAGPAVGAEVEAGRRAVEFFASRFSSSASDGNDPRERMDAAERSRALAESMQLLPRILAFARVSLHSNSDGPSALVSFLDGYLSPLFLQGHDVASRTQRNKETAALGVVAAVVEEVRRLKAGATLSTQRSTMQHAYSLLARLLIGAEAAVVAVELANAQGLELLADDLRGMLDQTSLDAGFDPRQLLPLLQCVRALATLPGHPHNEALRAIGMEEALASLAAERMFASDALIIALLSECLTLFRAARGVGQALSDSSSNFSSGDSASLSTGLIVAAAPFARRSVGGVVSRRRALPSAMKPLPRPELVALNLAGMSEQGKLLSWSADGRLIAAADASMRVCVWDTDSRELVRRIFSGWPESHTIHSLAMSPDGSLLLLAGRDSSGYSKMCIFRVADGRVFHAFRDLELGMTCAIWSADGSRVACSYRSSSHMVHIFDLHGDLVARVATPNSMSAQCVTWSPANHRLAIGCNTGAWLVNLLDGNKVTKLSGLSEVWRLHFSADGGCLIGFGSKTLGAWRMDDCSLLWSVSMADLIVSLSLSPDGLFVAVGCDGKANKLVLFDCATGEKVMEHSLPAGMQALSFAPTEYRLAVCLAQEDKVRVYTLAEQAVAGQPENAALRRTSMLAFDHLEHVQEEGWVAVSRDASVLVSASKSGLRQWNPSTRALKRELYKDRHMTCAAFDGDGKRVLAAAADGHVFVLNVFSGAQLHMFHAHKGNVNVLLVTPDATQFVTAGADQRVCVWDMGSRALQRELKLLAVPTALAVEPSGTPQLLVATDAATLHCYDPTSGKQLREYVGHTGTVAALCFTPDGLRFASASADATIRVWDVATCECTVQIQGERAFLSLCVSFDGLFLGGSEVGGHVSVWNARTGELMDRTLVENSPAQHVTQRHVQFAAGYRLVTAGEDGKLRQSNFQRFAT